ncbi:MAG: acetate kinase [Candidatus ainarchaeum sp.]|nr:acetate kinase [Candidatus ainarchaeum sp.]MDD3975688.1 acetate kinase [Candidatus ainarchaeum sp.]
MSNILVINAGSSSLKFELADFENEKTLIVGQFDGIGVSGRTCLRKIKFNDKKLKDEFDILEHDLAVSNLLDFLIENNIITSFFEINYVVHRIVHGAEKYNKTTELTSEVLEDLKKYNFLAPLHNPVNLKCVEILKGHLPESTKHFGVFDTAFHSTIPLENYLYALPIELYEKFKIRSYGFHGSSHKFVSRKACEILEKDYDSINIITCHLGNGQSICAIKNGKSFDTSMGFTPLDGLPMGTRSGSFDPEIILFLLENGYSKEDIKKLINKQSGLLGISKQSSDHRYIEENAIKGCKDCTLANDILVNRIIKIIGAYISEMKGINVIVFTGGVGEHSPFLRKLVLDHFSFLGLKLDESKNNSNELIISSEDSLIKVLVIPTNEELQMIRDVKELLN